jgi:hypothetical protein
LEKGSFIELILFKADHLPALDSWPGHAYMIMLHCNIKQRRPGPPRTAL